MSPALPERAVFPIGNWGKHVARCEARITWGHKHSASNMPLSFLVHLSLLPAVC